MSESQNVAILAHLEAGASLTPLEALEMFGCFRLGARVHELRRRGWIIESHLIRTQTGKRVASYSLESERDRAMRAALA